MLQRVSYGTLAIAILLTLFLLDVIIAGSAEELTGPIGELLRHGSIVPITVLAVFLLGAVEMNRLLRQKAARPHTAFAYVMIVVLVLTPWLSAAGLLGSGAAHVEGLYWQVVWLTVAGIGVGIAAVVRRSPEGSLRDAGATLLLIIYLGFLGSFALQLRCGRDMPQQAGAWLLLIVVLVTKASDIGAYFAGSAFGRHKLAAVISPAKSIEGTVGGLLASAATAVAIVAAGSAAIPYLARGTTAPDSFGMHSTLIFLSNSAVVPPLVRAGVLGLAISAAGQMGDLIESSFKRDARVKDSGGIIPPFGGILDLIDSPVLAMPVAWFLLTAVWRIA